MVLRIGTHALCAIVLVPWDACPVQVEVNQRKASDQDSSLESRSASSLGLFVALVCPLDEKSICCLELLDQLPSKQPAEAEELP